MARFLSLYLPQFHPVIENDEWWGKGFTEWTNVARARKLFPGHQQPNVPSDLGFYDLRMSEIREAQAQMAREAGIEGFCYWHYWFGNGKQLLEKPFNEVLASGKPDFPFCLAWANESWYKKLWNINDTQKDELLIEQLYLGEVDCVNHFNSLLPAFKDERYIKVNGKLFFIIYNAADSPEIPNIIKIWRRLAKESGLNDFYFVAKVFDCRRENEYLKLGFDAVYNDNTLNIHHHSSTFKKATLMLGRKFFGIPSVFQYKKAIKYMITDDCYRTGVIPVVAPNWDHTPRSRGNGLVLHNSKPEYFGKVLKSAICAVENKPKEEQIIIVKSWNEWGEGNYMEPDLKHGKGYLNIMKNIVFADKQK